MYRIFIETHFAASHQIYGYEGACSGLHGHTWKVEVEVKANQTNELGISFDFKELKAITEPIIQQLDHHHLNEVPPFDHENPTAENLSRYIYEKVRGQLPAHISISRVTVWESENYAVSYSEE